MYLFIQVLDTSQILLPQAPRAVHAQACCSACYRYQCSTPFLLLQVVDWHRIVSVICESAYLTFYPFTMRAIHIRDVQYISISHT